MWEVSLHSLLFRTLSGEVTVDKRRRALTLYYWSSLRQVSANTIVPRPKSFLSEARINTSVLNLIQRVLAATRAVHKGLGINSYYLLAGWVAELFINIFLTPHTKTYMRWLLHYPDIRKEYFSACKTHRNERQLPCQGLFIHKSQSSAKGKKGSLSKLRCNEVKRLAQHYTAGQ